MHRLHSLNLSCPTPREPRPVSAPAVPAGADGGQHLAPLTSFRRGPGSVCSFRRKIRSGPVTIGDAFSQREPISGHISAALPTQQTALLCQRGLIGAGLGSQNPKWRLAGKEGADRAHRGSCCSSAGSSAGFLRAFVIRREVRDRGSERLRLRPFWHLVTFACKHIAA